MKAITLAGGGPVAGLHIGALRALQEARIHFDIYALSCIGAWVGVVYNQFDEDVGLRKTERFFRERVFRADDSYARFPINSVFGPDFLGNWRALTNFVLDPASYEKLVLPGAMVDAAREAVSLLGDPARWNRGDVNLVLLELLSANPFVRYYTSMMYLSEMNGLTRLFYPGSSLLNVLEIEKLKAGGKPFIYHNAWNLSEKRIRQFANRPELVNDREGHAEKKARTDYDHDDYEQLTARSLCACSALPFVEQTVEIGDDVYCEGALVDTVNFKRLLDDFEDSGLEEIWVSRIVDEAQVRPPKNLHDALGNLCQLFAATVGEDDIKLFRMHAKERGWKGTIREIEVSSDISYEWTHSNFAKCIDEGKKATEALLRSIREGERSREEPAPER